MIIKVIKAALETEAERLAKLVINAIGARLETETRDFFLKSALHLTNTLQHRATDQATRLGKIKTIFTAGRIVDLDRIYVSQRLKWGNDVLDEFQFPARLLSERRAIITGSAGTGKSLFLRQLFRQLLRHTPSIYPVLVQLRDLKNRKYPDLLTHIAATISTRKHPLTGAHIQIAIEEGALALLLDGFDEIDFDERNRYEDEILELGWNYNRSVLVVTSRNDPERFEAWAEFNEFSLLPFSSDQTIELIEKSTEDADLKARFIARARKGLFATHETFLCNPLLAGMMLITFKRIADIPTKRHIFYREAFSALYERHDASKAGQYSRKRHAALDVDTFTDVFGIFCFLTYADSVFTFSEKSAIGYIEDSFAFAGCTAQPKAFLRDLLESVCMLLRDGDEIVFAHRSFQEYFCAVFVTHNRSGDQYHILNQIAGRGPQDSVLTLMMGISAEFVEKEWVLPSLEKFFRMVENLPLSGRLSAFLSSIASEVEVTPDPPSFDYIVGDHPLRGALFHLPSLYPQVFTRAAIKLGAGSRRRIKDELRHLGLWRNGMTISQSFRPSIEHENLFDNLGVGPWLDTLTSELQALRSQLRAKYSRREVSLRELLTGKRRPDNP